MKSKTLLIIAAIVFIGVGFFIAFDTGKETSSTEASKTTLPSSVPVNNKTTDAPAPRSGEFFPKAEGWPIDKEDVLGTAEQRMILERAKNAVENGIIQENELNDYILSERQILIDSIREDNEGPAERELKE